MTSPGRYAGMDNGWAASRAAFLSSLGSAANWPHHARRSVPQTGLVLATQAYATN